MCCHSEGYRSTTLAFHEKAYPGAASLEHVDEGWCASSEARWNNLELGCKIAGRLARGATTLN